MSQDTATTPQPQPTKNPRRCRYIKTAGDQCRAKAMTGNHYCYLHKHNRKPTFAGVKGYDRVAFLEDAASVQLMLSQAMQGLLDRSLDHHSARTMFYGCQVASGLVRLDMLNERWRAENKQPHPEPVTETTKSENSDPLGVDEEYRGPTGTFEPQWSFSKYLYEQECEELGRPKPTCAADFPASGWLTEDEIKEDPQEWVKRTLAHKLELHEKAEAARKAADPESGGQGPTAQDPTAQDPITQDQITEPIILDGHPEPRAQRAVEGPAFPAAPRSSAKSCPCGGLNGGDPCDECLDRQQRNAPPAINYQPFTDSLDLNAAADPSTAASPSTAAASPSTAEPCTLQPVTCTLPSEVPRERHYCGTPTKQEGSGNNPSPRVAAKATIAELRRLMLGGFANRLPSLDPFQIRDLDEASCDEAIAL